MPAIFSAPNLQTIENDSFFKAKIAAQLHLSIKFTTSVARSVLTRAK